MIMAIVKVRSTLHFRDHNGYECAQHPVADAAGLIRMIADAAGIDLIALGDSLAAEDAEQGKDDAP